MSDHTQPRDDRDMLLGPVSSQDDTATHQAATKDAATPDDNPHEVTGLETTGGKSLEGHQFLDDGVRAGQQSSPDLDDSSNQGESKSRPPRPMSAGSSASNTGGERQEQSPRRGIAGLSVPNEDSQAESQPPRRMSAGLLALVENSSFGPPVSESLGGDQTASVDTSAAHQRSLTTTAGDPSLNTNEELVEAQSAPIEQQGPLSVLSGFGGSMYDSELQELLSEFSNSQSQLSAFGWDEMTPIAVHPQLPAPSTTVGPMPHYLGYRGLQRVNPYLSQGGIVQDAFNQATPWILNQHQLQHQAFEMQAQRLYDSSHRWDSNAQPAPSGNILEASNPNMFANSLDLNQARFQGVDPGTGYRHHDQSTPEDYHQMPQHQMPEHQMPQHEMLHHQMPYGVGLSSDLVDIMPSIPQQEKQNASQHDQSMPMPPPRRESVASPYIKSSPGESPRYSAPQTPHASSDRRHSDQSSATVRPGSSQRANQVMEIVPSVENNALTTSIPTQHLPSGSQGQIELSGSAPKVDASGSTTKGRADSEGSSSEDESAARRISNIRPHSPPPKTPYVARTQTRTDVVPVGVSGQRGENPGGRARPELAEAINHVVWADVVRDKKKLSQAFIDWVDAQQHVNITQRMIPVSKYRVASEDGHGTREIHRGRDSNIVLQERYERTLDATIPLLQIVRDVFMPATGNNWVIPPMLHTIPMIIISLILTHENPAIMWRQAERIMWRVIEILRDSGIHLNHVTWEHDIQPVRVLFCQARAWMIQQPPGRIFNGPFGSLPSWIQQLKHFWQYHTNAVDWLLHGFYNGFLPREDVRHGINLEPFWSRTPRLAPMWREDDFDMPVYHPSEFFSRIITGLLMEGIACIIAGVNGEEAQEYEGQGHYVNRESDPNERRRQAGSRRGKKRGAKAAEVEDGDEETPRKKPKAEPVKRAKAATTPRKRQTKSAVTKKPAIEQDRPVPPTPPAPDIGAQNSELSQENVAIDEGDNSQKSGNEALASAITAPQIVSTPAMARDTPAPSPPRQRPRYRIQETPAPSVPIDPRLLVSDASRAFLPRTATSFGRGGSESTLRTPLPELRPPINVQSPGDGIDPQTSISPSGDSPGGVAPGTGPSSG